MRKISIAFCFSIVAVILTACSPIYTPQTVQYVDYSVAVKERPVNNLSGLLKPYTDSVTKSMSDVVAVAGMALEKKSPEGTLNNILTDAMLYMAKEKYQTNVDAAFLNYGAIRLPAIAKGPITKGEVFEIAPFDNILVLQKLTGKVIHQVLDLAAAKGGWPCAGMSYQIKDKKAVNIKIGEQPIDEAATYTVTLVDYIANGGDNCDMLKTIPQVNNGYLYRDAIIAYFTKFDKEGKQIISKLENRVSNAE